MSHLPRRDTATPPCGVRGVHRRMGPLLRVNDPEMIGIHMLEILNKFRNEGIVE